MSFETTFDGSGLIPYPEFWSAKHLQGCLDAMTGVHNGIIRIPVASNYDLDNDYDYIMSRALRSYKQHREKEKADSRKALTRHGYLKRQHLRPKTAPTARFVGSMRARGLGGGAGAGAGSGAERGATPAPTKVFMPKVGDEINAVHKANPAQEEDDERSARRVLQVATVSLKMMQDFKANKKVDSFLKRNKPTHPWYSHSYPNVKPLEKFVRPPHAYMSASVGERELSSALSHSSGSNSRSSSAKSSPSHGCKAKSSSSKAKYYYDGGLFTHPKNSNPDYFVIHPDWVSESMSIQKLSLTERQPPSAPINIPKSKSMTWPGRRCNSAPPPKYRNPITWDP